MVATPSYVRAGPFGAAGGRLTFVQAWLESERGAYLLYAVSAAGLIYDLITRRHSGFLIAAMAIAGGVGAVEIMGRYRQAPWRALMSVSGFIFVAVNVGAAAFAWYLIHVMGWMPTAPEETAQFLKAHDYKEATKVKAMIVAGFGALVFLRASIFKVRVSEADVGVGPAALLDSVLLIADRGVDRREAVARSRDVDGLVSLVGVDKVRVAALLGKYSLALMQNVDEKTRDEVEKAIAEALSDVNTPDSIKFDIVALKLSIVVGRDVLDAAARILSARLRPEAVNALAAEIRAGGTPS